MRTLPLRVIDAAFLSPTLRRVRMTHAHAQSLPSITPGSHLVLSLPTRGGVRRNAYSITQREENGAFYEIIVRHAPTSRGGSAFVHNELVVGTELTASSPSNFLALESTARKILMIGGGVGVTPLLSLALAHKTSRKALEFHQFCTLPEKPAFESLLAPLGAGHYHVHTSRQALDLASVFSRQPLGTYLYTCGPIGMMEHVRETALAMGWPEGRIHQESFGSGGGKAFTAYLARSGISVEVEEDQTLLDALESANIAVSCLCRGGACGMCRTAVLEGEPDHRDHFLSTAEKASSQWIMPCVSRARDTSLTLDL